MCPECGKELSLTKDGMLRLHGYEKITWEITYCAGAGGPPLPVPDVDDLTEEEDESWKEGKCTFFVGISSRGERYICLRPRPCELHDKHYW
jgi:hypothetical protein